MCVSGSRFQCVKVYCCGGYRSGQRRRNSDAARRQAEYERRGRPGDGGLQCNSGRAFEPVEKIARSRRRYEEVLGQCSVHCYFSRSSMSFLVRFKRQQ